MTYNERCIQEALYLIKYKTTVRETAKAFNVSKSTVHKDVTDRLKKANVKLYYKVKEILDENFSVRHIRGGEATRRKYAKIKKPDEKMP
ncbi:MAG: stage III sporulation protein D [Clostridiales bacterium]|nr:stage III sporulation protein D [Clostridiales bacterium]